MPTAPFTAPERDLLQKVGRGKSSGGTYYTIPGIAPGSSITTRTLNAGADQYCLWLTSTPIVVDQLAAEVATAAGTNFRIGFYKANANWQPMGAPMADSGNLDAASTGVKTYTPSTPIFVPRGRYLSVINADGAATLRSFPGSPVWLLDSALGASGSVVMPRVTRAYAAFPTPGTAWDTAAVTAGVPHQVVVYRISTP